MVSCPPTASSQSPVRNIWTGSRNSIATERLMRRYNALDLRLISGNRVFNGQTAMPGSANTASADKSKATIGHWKQSAERELERDALSSTHANFRAVPIDGSNLSFILFDRHAQPTNNESCSHYALCFFKG
uniref:Uncharacterized protein n=1 Tax=Trichuris muris TaxID=70415 RepID=A0A5S6QKM8_TRIMR